MLITPTMLNIAKRSDAKERRTLLRKLVTPIMKQWSDTQVREALRVSPIAGKGSKRVSVRETSLGLRDVLNERTLWMIAIMRGWNEEGSPAVYGITVARHRIVEAIADPLSYGIKSAGTTTGYAFGEPSCLAHYDIRQWLLEERHAGIEARELKETFPELISSAFKGHAYSRIVTKASEDPDLWVLEDARRNPPETDTDTVTEEKPIVKRTLVKFEMPADKSQVGLINLALKGADLPPLEELHKVVIEGGKAVSKLEVTEAEVAKLSEALRKAKARPAPSTKVSASGELPEGKVVYKCAQDVFGGVMKSVPAFKFDVPVWEWDGEHPHVPEADDSYVWQPMPLFGVLRAIVNDDRAWLQGHTGTGKTTLIEQVAARLNWPVMRINFDSEISRLDLIGRDTIVTDEKGNTSSKFVDGVLPTMISGPYIGIFDEIDFIRPDVAYVMQSVLEGNGMIINEDGGRRVERNPWNRLFATANTNGQGDESGLYQGARPQSGAMLDRFAAFITVNYLEPGDRRDMLKARVPELDDELADQLVKYSTEHIEAFKGAKIMQPLSPRGLVAAANWTVQYLSLFPASAKGRKTAMREAINATILDRASSQDRAVMHGIAQRVFADFS